MKDCPSTGVHQRAEEEAVVVATAGPEDLAHGAGQVQPGAAEEEVRDVIATDDHPPVTPLETQPVTSQTASIYLKPN